MKQLKKEQKERKTRMKQNKANVYKKQTNNYKLKSKGRNIKNVKYRKIKKKLKVIPYLLKTYKCKNVKGRQMRQIHT